MRSASTLSLLIILLLGTSGLAYAQSSGKPGFSRLKQAKSKQISDATEQSILANIENQKMIIDLEDASSPEYPEMIIALADFYWDLSETYFRRAEGDKLAEDLYQAEERKDAEKIKALKSTKLGFVMKQREYQEKTVAQYRDVIRRFPGARKLPEIRYYLGYHLYAMGRLDEGKDIYYDLVLKHPDSPYVPDSLVNIGEYYFELNDYASALKLYAQVEKYPDAPVLAYSTYKQSWSYYNMGDYNACLKKMVDVIRIADAQHRAGVLGALDLKGEAQGELIFPYSKVGKPQAAVGFFKKYAPTTYLKVSTKLAELYAEQTEYQKSSKLLRTLIKEARSVKIEGKAQAYLALKFQRLIVDNARRSVDKAATYAEVQSLIRQFEELSVNAPRKFMSKEEVEVERLVLAIATAYHNEFKTTKEEKTLELTQLLYDEYLRLFRDKPNAYDISYNNALLMLMTGRYEAAAEEFERVIAMRPDGKHSDDAGERTVVAYLKTLKVQNQAVKSEAQDDLKKRQLEPSERKFVAAVDRWMGIVERKGANPETADNIPPARFAAAKLLYDANQFDGAAKRFAVFYQRHRDHSLWEDAARHVLSSYGLSHDVDNLRRFANMYLKDATLMETALAEDVHRIRNEFNFQECFKFEKKRAFLGAAQCFIDYQKEYPNAEKAPAAIFNAGLNFFKAKQVEKALEMQKRLYEQYNTHELAPKALYSIAEIFRETAVYEQSAEVYEVFVQSYPNHPLAEKALRFASIFRKTLAQYSDAVNNLELYLKRYPDPVKSPRVHLDIVLIHEKQKSPNPILRAVRQHLKRYKTEPGGIRLRVLRAKGRALARLGKDKKAKQAFEDTVNYFKGMEDDAVRALQLPAISAVAESHFNLGEGLLARARWVKLKGSEAKMKKAIKQKLTLMNEAKKIYEQVIKYGHPGWMIAAYSQLGLAYRDLARAVENTEVPRKLRRNPDAVEEYKTVMAERAKPIRSKAIASYAKALSIAREEHWFNKYSQRAENAIAQLDLSDRSIKESRIKPNRVESNSGLPDFKQEVK